jgi:porin
MRRIHIGTPPLRRFVVIVCFCHAAIWGAFAGARDANEGSSDARQKSNPGSVEENNQRESQASPLAKLDDKLTMKGWDFAFPGFEEGIWGDAGGLRTQLGRAGIGFIETSRLIYEKNTLGTPRNASAKDNGTYPDGKAYIGEDNTFVTTSNLWITYDTSRWGVPDGQLILSIAKNDCDDHIGFAPTSPIQFGEIAWFQTLAHRKIDFKAGWDLNLYEFIGSNVGGNFANTFGPAQTIQVLMGLSMPEAPTARFTWHVSDNFYEEFGVQRSMPVAGKTKNPYYDENTDNPLGIHFNSSIPGTGELFLNEIGYKQEAAPGKPSTWFRYTSMFNNSSFTDFTRLASNGMVRGNNAQSFLLDHQLWQQNPATPATAYQGFYVGLSYQMASPNATPVTSYEEGRAYWMAPFRRPADLFQIVYGHNEFNKYLADFENQFANQTGIYGQLRSNTYTATYLAHLRRGVFASGGFAYTDRPSQQYFIGEGSSLNFLGSVLLIF